ncbi:hypothetical protein [Burkholderia contaminans]|uniref:hypothetical protein n=1 Tax=Burkholderia contaminans TaxID=488447 RepID=UPI002A35C52B|nr:hypothetical protein [Burkholderia contaminans]
MRPEYERNSPRMSSNSYVNLKIATCLVRYADDRLIDQRFLSAVITAFVYFKTKNAWKASGPQGGAR